MHKKRVFKILPEIIMSSCDTNWFIVCLPHRFFFPLRCRFVHSSSFYGRFSSLSLSVRVSSLSWIAAFAPNVRAKEWVMQTTVNGLSCEQTAAYYIVSMYAQFTW